MSNDRLAREIRFDLEALRETAALAAQLLQHAQQEHAPWLAAAAAKYIADVFMGVENLWKRRCRHLGQPVPDGPTSHHEALLAFLNDPELGARLPPEMEGQLGNYPTCAGKSTERKNRAMGARIRPFAVVRSGGQWRGTSGTAAGCSGPSRPEALGRGPVGAPRFGAGRAEPPRPYVREAGFARTGRNYLRFRHRFVHGYGVGVTWATVEEPLRLIPDTVTKVCCVWEEWLAGQSERKKDSAE